MPTLTIDVTAPHATRVAAAVGKLLNLMDTATPPAPRAATMAEVKAWVIDYIKGMTLAQERAVAADVAAVAVTPVDPT